ncbi:DNA-binding response regulator [Methylovirgula ligni]|uniref:LuxR family two component transcriptional regulator n=1 Tax=Methylovirgula ligni TaxID=569860 RepID=A0A3D9Z3G9_9HYPH|nr:response regulator FixJ [Methylovirgula ligni]QAY95790.1 DNA-binding response regulator [Methylovirgula ligni]REF88828.1 LuxR family two component transcriptional regulator [Methylovirgula ligni]
MPSNAVVHLIDDDGAVRHSLAFVLTAAGHAVRVYESGSAFLAALQTLQPGCIVSDVRMPGVDGLELLRKLRELGVDMPVIIITGHADVPLAVGAMKAGASDFIEKPFDDETLLRAIRIALESYEASSDRDAERAEIRGRLNSLTPREREVLDGLLAGYPNKTIAYDLKLSPRTVEVHRGNVMAKMGATSLSSLVRMALTAKVLPTD